MEHRIPKEANKHTQEGPIRKKGDSNQRVGPCCFDLNPLIQHETQDTKGSQETHPGWPNSEERGLKSKSWPLLLRFNSPDSAWKYWKNQRCKEDARLYYAVRVILKFTFESAPKPQALSLGITYDIFTQSAVFGIFIGCNILSFRRISHTFGGWAFYSILARCCIIIDVYFVHFHIWFVISFGD